MFSLYLVYLPKLDQLPANQDQQQNVQAGKDGVELQPILIARAVELLELI